MRTAAAVVVLAVVGLVGTGCLATTTRACENGRICPDTQVCSPHGDGTCVDQSQIEDCSAGQDTCTIPGVEQARCYDGLCLPAGCGNNIVDPGEACDNGNRLSGDGCSARCDSDETCGNAFLDIAQGEGCDCGSAAFTGTRPTSCKGMPNSDAPDAVCQSNCQLRGCGDNVINGLEDCDGTALVDTCESVGYYGGTLGCLSTCRFDVSQCTGRCGDDTRNAKPGDPIEPCDGTDLAGLDCAAFGYYGTSGLACTDVCTFDASACTGGRCGDGILQAAEDCDGAQLGGADCTNFGFYQPGTLACNDACNIDTSACQQYCGDRIQQPTHEQCDGKLPTATSASCAAFGFESGDLGCSLGCGWEFASCIRDDATGLTTGLTGNRGQMWSSGPNDLWVVGVGTMWHWNGAAWASTTMSFDYEAIVGFSSTDVFAAGHLGFGGGAVAHWNGTSWTEKSLTGSALSGIGGASGADVYAAGGSNVWHSTDHGATWVTVSGATTVLAGLGSVFGVAATSTTNVYLVGNLGTVVHYNGVKWFAEVLPAPAQNIDYTGIYAANANDIDIVGSQGVILHWDGAAGAFSITPSGTGRDLLGIFGTPTNRYAVGKGGTLLHGDGLAWTSIDPGPNLSGDIGGVWATNPRDVYLTIGTAYAGGTAKLYHYDANRFLSLHAPAFDDLPSVWAANSSAIFVAAGADGVERYDGTTWTQVATPAPTTNAVWGTATSDVFAAGGGVSGFASMSHSIGAAFAGQTLPGATPTLNAIWGSSGTDVYAVGGSTAGTSFVHYNGTWSAVAGTGATGTLNAVWGSSATDVYAGGQTSLVHLAGATWSPVVLPGAPSPNAIRAIWGSAANDVWVGGATLYHWDGAAWTKFVVPGGAVVHGLGGTGPSDAFLVGDGGTLAHWDGFAWSQMDAGSASTLGAVVALPHADAIAVGEAGTILRRARACSATETACTDGNDDDCDGKIDCNDPDCAANAACTGANPKCMGQTPTVATPAMCVAGTIAITGTTNNADTSQTLYGCDGFEENGPAVVYSYTTTAAATGTLTATLAAPGHDLDLVVLGKAGGKACEPRLAGCLGASSTAGGTESVSIPVAPSTTYYFVVETFAADAGGFTLTIPCL